jgi:hypothetical protein
LFEAIKMVAAGLTVWYLSGEDPKVEIDRRIAAHCQWGNITLGDLSGRLYVDDKTTFQLFIGKSPRAAAISFDEASLTQFETAILQDNIDVVMLDPFVSFHSVPENDNGCIDAVVKRLALIAYRANCCIEISHHVRKPFQGQSTITVDDARGGGAIINAVRSGRVINRMSQQELDDANAGGKSITSDQRNSYIRLDRGKRNMAPSDKASWFMIVSVPLPNGDNVQALEPWKFPEKRESTDDDARWVKNVLRNQQYRVDVRSPEWLGVLLSQQFDRPISNETDKRVRKRNMTWINTTLTNWVRDGVINTVENNDANGIKRMFYISGDIEPPQREEPPLRMFAEAEDSD